MLGELLVRSRYTGVVRSINREDHLGSSDPLDARTGGRGYRVRIDFVRSGSYVSAGMGADLSSGDLARATGHTVRAIRFYEEEGLLKPAVVSEGGHRRYTHDDLE